MSDKVFDPVIPAEGWHVVHLFYAIEHGEWQTLTADEQRTAKINLSSLVQEIRATDSTQLLTFSMVSPKSDLGFMLLTPDLHVANRFEKRLSLSLGPEVLTPVYSYLSLTERSEYFPSEADYAAQIEREQGLNPGTPEHDVALQTWRDRMNKYAHDRLYPQLPAWAVFCFYTMTKRRGEQFNWYTLSYDERKKLMSGHSRIGRKWHGKIQQLITGSMGLDDDEWGVSLFAHDTLDLKGILYEMRFDDVSAKYGDFGDFYVGLQLPIDEIFRRLAL